MKKFELTTETKICDGRTLYRIKALESFGGVCAGDLGGWVEKEKNLSHGGDARVSDNARVYGDAWVSDNARVYGDAWVSGDARVYGDAWVSGNAWVSGDARVSRDEHVMWISRIGSRNGTTTFFATKTGIFVNCGCFSGSLEAFAAAVDKNHGDSEHGKAYRLAIELAKLRIKLPEEE